MASNIIQITEGSGKNIKSRTVTDPLDSTSKDLEATILGAGKINFPTTPQESKQTAAGLYPSTAVDIQGYGYVGIRFTFGATTTSVTFRILLYDDDATLFAILPSPTDVYTAVSQATESFTEESETRYLGTFFLMANESGAESMKIRLTAAPTGSGNVSIFVAGV